MPMRCKGKMGTPAAVQSVPNVHQLADAPAWLKGADEYKPLLCRPIHGNGWNRTLTGAGRASKRRPRRATRPPRRFADKARRASGAEGQPVKGPAPTLPRPRWKPVRRSAPGRKGNRSRISAAGSYNSCR